VCAVLNGPFYKFWWSQKLDQLKLKAIASVEHGRTLFNLNTVVYFLNISKINYFTKSESVKKNFVTIKVTPIIFMRHCCANRAQPSGRAGKLNLKIKLLILYK